LTRVAIAPGTDPQLTRITRKQIDHMAQDRLDYFKLSRTPLGEPGRFTMSAPDRMPRCRARNHGHRRVLEGLDAHCFPRGRGAVAFDNFRVAPVCYHVAQKPVPPWCRIRFTSAGQHSSRKFIRPAAQGRLKEFLSRQCARRFSVEFDRDSPDLSSRSPREQASLGGNDDGVNLGLACEVNSR
jgi:hypothetical protein